MKSTSINDQYSSFFFNNCHSSINLLNINFMNCYGIEYEYMIQKMNVNTINSSSLRSSLYQHIRPQTSHKRVHKTPTQPCLNAKISQDLSSVFFIENLKRAFPNNQSTGTPSHSRMQKGPLSTITNTIQSSAPHRIAYKRGINAQRTFYQGLTQKLSQLQKSVSNIEKLNVVQIFQYKQKYLNDHLQIFFKQLGEQCYEKSIFASHLWLTIKSIFQELIRRLVKELTFNQKNYLKQCYNTHDKYQKKFEEFKQELDNKDAQIYKFKTIISKITMKNKKKCRKNKQMSHGIVQIVGRLSTIQKQRNQLKCQYINMLTLGYQGGMEYDQAKKFTISRFGIENQLNESMTSLSSITYLKPTSQLKKGKQSLNTKKFNKIEQNKQQSNINQLDPSQVRRKSKKQKSAALFFEKQDLDKRVHKIKQRYVYGSNRLIVPDEEINSDESQSWNMISNFRHQASIPQRRNNQNQAIKNGQELDINLMQQTPKRTTTGTNFKTLENKRVQTIFNYDGDIKKQSVGTNLGSIQMYRDNLIRNKQIQTQTFKTFKSFISTEHRSTQYYQIDCLQFEREQQAYSQVQRKQIVEPEKFSQTFSNYIIEDKSEKCMEQSEIQKQAGTEQQFKIQKQIKQIIVKKKQTVKKKTASQINKQKTSQRSSIFKRNSMMLSSFNNNLQRNSKHKYSKLLPPQNLIFQEKNNFKQQRRNSDIYQDQISEKTNQQNLIRDNTQSSILQSQKQSISEISVDEIDYARTDMMSVIQNMSKLTPKGIYIDEAMIFLLKKSLFRIKHQNCDNVFKKNSDLITKIRESVVALKNVKTQLTSKNVIKMLGNVYDSAFAQLVKNEQQAGKNKVKKSHRNSDSATTNARVYNDINLLNLLKDTIQKQYPMYKFQQVEHKIVLLAKSIESESSPNYMIKNFLMLSCLDDSIFSPVIFSADIEFYFYLLIELNVCTDQKSKNIRISDIDRELRSAKRASGRIQGNKSGVFNTYKQNDTENQTKVYKISSSNGSYNHCYTNALKLKQTLPAFLKKFYKKHSLLTYIENKISDTLQKFFPASSFAALNSSLSGEFVNSNSNTHINSQILNARLDVFKCCHLIMQSIFSYKLDVLKSYAQITQIPEISMFGLFNEELFIDVLGFLRMTKLEMLNTVNKFRYNFGKSNTQQGISLINIVNFCLNHDLPDFDQILYEIICKYPVSAEIASKIQKMHITYGKFNKIQKICLYLYKKNVLQSCVIESKPIIPQKSEQQQQLSVQTSPLGLATPPRQPTPKSKQQISQLCSNSNKFIKMQKSKKHKQIWEIIGASSSYSLIHIKVVQLQASELLQKMLGSDMVMLYTASLCQLQEKKYTKTR